MEELAKKAIEYLHAKRPFVQRLFESAGLSDAEIQQMLEIDKQIFFETSSIRNTLKVLDRIAAANSHQGRMVGLRANIRDGKTAFLNYLRYDKSRQFLPVFIDQNEHDEWRMILRIVFTLFFEMKSHEILGEAEYNDANVDLRKCFLSSDDPRSVVITYLSKFKSKLAGRKILILCDNANEEVSLQAFQTLLGLDTLEPPFERIFGDSLLVVIFTTSEVNLEKIWQSGNFEQAGHHFGHLKISAEDMFNITRNILQVSFEGWNGDAGELQQKLQDNPVFPFEEEDLNLFLQNKAKKEVIRDADRQKITEVVELQLDNMLNLLQKVVDQKAESAADELIQTNDLLRIDLASR